ncbi:hypothetical protein [Actinomycetospora soli]|uniref:hypothetical protein n=1 Tax=Actinomycetospora soli TaxID=2893887 RepID=UPI001E3F42CC|nr:hypothetical protein [Actinomycetospora soli]MCD2191149.1 hypothetical protein [Actinomycetospora soli]
MPEPDGRGSARAALPPNARIVIVSAGFGEPGDDEADELARQLHAAGWWVDLPRVAGAARSHPLRRLARRREATGFERAASQVASRLGVDAHAVVVTHPRTAAALGRLRLRGALAGPLIACFTEVHRPVVGCDLLLTHPADAARTVHAVATDHARRRPTSAVER